MAVLAPSSSSQRLQGWTERVCIVTMPLLVSLAIKLHVELHQPLELYVGAVVGAFLLWAVMRRPSLVGPVILVLLPVQTVVFAWIHAQGLGAGSFRPLASLKELAVFGLLLRGEADRRRLGRPLDLLDRVALAYLALAVAYLVAGRFVVDIPGNTASARLVGFREDAFFVLVFYAARNVTWSTDGIRRVLRSLAVGCAVAAYFVLWQQLSESGFTSWLEHDAQIVRYLANVLDLDPPGIQRTLHHFADPDVRLMGSFLSPIELADYLVIPFGLLLALGLRGRKAAITLSLLSLTGFLVLETRTRIAIFALGAMVFVVLLLRRAASSDRRVTAALAAGVAAAVLVPVILAPIVLGKVNADESNRGHISEWSYGFDELVKRPQGSGLGSNSSASVRFAGIDRSNGNAYLLIGNELGVIGLALLLALIGLTIRTLLRRLRVDPDPPAWVIGAGLIWVGVGVQGLTHHALESLPVAWATWLLLGMATTHEAVQDSLAETRSAFRSRAVRPKDRARARQPRSHQLRRVSSWRTLSVTRLASLNARSRGSV